MKSYYLDPRFILALALGPCVWLALYFVLSPSPSQFDLKLFLMVCAVYPVLEELAFRGFLQSWMLENTVLAKQPVAGISFANVLTSALFAAAHLYSQPAFWAISVFFPSLIFGYFRDRYNRVTPSILLHSWYNIGFFLVLR